MDINERCQKLPVIKTHRNPWGGGLQEDGTLQFPFPIYSKSVCDWIDALYKLDLTDRDYFDHFEKIKDKPIEELTRDEILTRMTFTKRPFEGAGELKLQSGRVVAFSGIFDNYQNKPYEYLCGLKQIEIIPVADYYKFFAKIEYKILNQYGYEVSGGERAEFNLLQEINDAYQYDMAQMKSLMIGL